jgi:hypothetical protein
LANSKSLSFSILIFGQAQDEVDPSVKTNLWSK